MEDEARLDNHRVDLPAGEYEGEVDPRVVPFQEEYRFDTFRPLLRSKVDALLLPAAVGAIGPNCAGCCMEASRCG